MGSPVVQTQRSLFSEKGGGAGVGGERGGRVKSDSGNIFQQGQDFAITKSPRMKSWAVTDLLSDHPSQLVGKYNQQSNF